MERINTVLSCPASSDGRASKTSRTEPPPQQLQLCDEGVDPCKLPTYLQHVGTKLAEILICTANDSFETTAHLKWKSLG